MRVKQFTLRNLFVFTAIVGLLLGFHLSNVRSQRRAVAEIRAYQGSVDYQANLQLPIPKWALDIFGEDFFTGFTASIYPKPK